MYIVAARQSLYCLFPNDVHIRTQTQCNGNLYFNLLRKYNMFMYTASVVG